MFECVRTMMITSFLAFLFSHVQQMIAILLILLILISCFIPSLLCEKRTARRANVSGQIWGSIECYIGKCVVEKKVAINIGNGGWLIFEVMYRVDALKQHCFTYIHIKLSHSYYKAHEVVKKQTPIK